MFSVTTLLLILWVSTATSCVLGFQSAQLRIKTEQSAPFDVDVQITVSSKNKKVAIKELFIKSIISKGSSESVSHTATITWTGFEQDLIDVEFKIGMKGGNVSKKFTLERAFSIKKEFTIKKDIKAGKINEIIFDPRDYL